MKIDAIDIYHVGLPLRKPRPTKAGRLETLETVLVRLQSGDASGWGEASPGAAPVAGPEWAGGAFAVLRDWLAPRVAGSSVESGDSLQERLAPFDGNQFAKAALDTAWWDLHARLRGEPLHKLLGGKREAVEVGVSFDQMETIDELLAALGRAFDESYARAELKMRPGWDLQMLNIVRQEFPTETIHTDVEGDLTMENTEIIYRLDDFGLAMVEQPLAADDLVGLAMIQESIRTPVCLDESIATPRQADMALDLHSGKYVNLKPGRVGGLTPAVAIHDACHDACVPCYVGAVPQTGIGFRHGLALAAKENCLYPAEFIPPEELAEQDPAPLPEPVRDEPDGLRQIPLGPEPGIGVDPDLKLLEKHTLGRASL